MQSFQNMSEEAGTSRNQPEDPASPLVQKELLTVEEAVVYFRDQGLPRSPEAIRGYCRQGKIESTTIQGLKGEQHVLSRESADVYITERKRVLETMSRDMPADAGTSRKLTVTSVTSRDMPEHAGMARETDPDPDTLKAKDEEIAKLRDEVMSLRIDKAARDQIVAMLRDERAQLADTAMEKSRRVGELETRLQLAEPASDTPEHRPAYREAGDSAAADPAPGKVY